MDKDRQIRELKNSNAEDSDAQTGLRGNFSPILVESLDFCQSTGKNDTEIRLTLEPEQQLESSSDSSDELEQIQCPDHIDYNKGFKWCIPGSWF